MKMRPGLIAFAWLLAAASASAAPAKKPNVLVIVADDLGYHDVGFHGSTQIPTPHLDALAGRSVRCTNGYVSHPFCSPTRAGIMTGRYPQRFGHERNPAWLPESTTSGLSLDVITFPALMRQAGYSTGAVGKWHLGAHPQFHPLKRGFDEYFGILGGGHVYFPGGKGGVEYTIPLDRNGVAEEQTRYLTDHFAAEAEAFVGRHADDGKPWMLYLAFNAPHTPLEAPEEWLRKLASIPDRSRRTYAAMIASMDAAIGRVMTKLDGTGQLDDTLVFFASDNGGPDLSKRSGVNFTDNAPLRGAKGTMLEGGIRVPFLVSWPARLKAGTYEQPVSAMDFLPTSLAAAGASAVVPANVDGVDLVPFLSGAKTGRPHESLFWRSRGPGGDYAARRGDLKLVRNGKQPPELYDLATDPGERHDLAAERPQAVAELVAAVADWEKTTIPPSFDEPRPRAAAKP